MNEENPFKGPDVDTSLEESCTDGDYNGLFKQLGIVAAFLAVSMLLAYHLSFLGGLWGYRAGSPKDFAIQTAIIVALGCSQIWNLFLPRGRFSCLFSLRFVKIIFKSLVVTWPVWLIVALCGSWVVDEFRVISGERTWYQIFLVLSSTSVTLLVWSKYWNTPDQPQSSISDS